MIRWLYAFKVTLVIPHADGSLATTMYKTPTHTYQYLQWDSPHTISAKYRVVNTLNQRAKVVCSSPQFYKKKSITYKKHYLNVNIQCGPYSRRK